MSFSKAIYDDARRLFPDGTVETLVTRSPGAEAAVRLVHTATGMETICSDFPTQFENFIAPAIRLRIACDKRVSS